MDKLGTYALVAALKEISKKPVSAQPPPNERWISLRSCMTQMQPVPIDPPGPPQPEAPPSGLSTAHRRGGYSHIRAIDMRHQTARKQRF